MKFRVGDTVQSRRTGQVAGVVIGYTVGREIDYTDGYKDGFIQRVLDGEPSVIRREWPIVVIKKDDGDVQGWEEDRLQLIGGRKGARE